MKKNEILEKERKEIDELQTISLFAFFKQKYKIS
jgi:hypothetical protein